MLEAGPATLDSLRYEFGHHGAAFDPEPAIIREPEMIGGIADYQAAESLVANEYVGAESENEILDTELACRGYSPCQIVSGCCIVEDIGWTANTECGVLTEGLVTLYATALQPINQLPVGFGAGIPRI